MIEQTGVVSQYASFFQLIFGAAEGWVAIARRAPDGPLERRFYQWPNQQNELYAWLMRWRTSHNLYYCPHLFQAGQGPAQPVKTNVSVCKALWADLDECPPSRLLVSPSIALQTSGGRWQALWLLAEPTASSLAEELSRRIVYAHRADGADIGGWHLAKLLRIPYTYNFKHHPGYFIAAKIEQHLYNPDDFSRYPPVSITEIPMPTVDHFDVDTLIAQIPLDLNDLYTNEPPLHGWSTASWNLTRGLVETGLPMEETFAIMRTAACNKYKRDGRKEQDLWKEIVKAYEKQDEVDIYEAESITPTRAKFQLPDLLTEEERDQADAMPSIIKRYVNWATEQTDACPLYHQAGGFMITSTLLSSSVRLPTSFGMLIPNLWYLILADSTLSRKSTAMDMAMELVGEVDEGYKLANDGSIEGLMASLAGRSGRASVFQRDEVSGLLSQMAHKDYYSGMSEAFARLYDGKPFERVLRREVINIREPIFLFFGGGAKTRTMDILNSEHVTSGFIPRFIFICGEADPSKIRPLGPPTDENDTERQSLIKEFTKLYEFYHHEITQTIGNSTLIQPKIFKAKLTPEAWNLYNDAERRLTYYALNHAISAALLTPTLDRLAKSGLKLALLISASREYQENIIVTYDDMILALWYIEQWVPHSLEVISKIGHGIDERRLMQIYEAVRVSGKIRQSALMAQHRLMKKQSNDIFETLESRGLLRRSTGGRDPEWVINE